MKPEEIQNKQRKNRSIFEITCSILIGLLIVGIIVQIGIIINLNKKNKELKEKMKNIPEITEPSGEEMPEDWQENYLKMIN